MIELIELFMFFCCKIEEGAVKLVFLPPISDFHATRDQKE